MTTPNPEADRLRAIVRKFVEDHSKIRWGNDGDCGSTRLVESLESDFEEPPVSDQNPAPPILVHIPLRIVGRIRDIAKDAQSPSVAYSEDRQKMFEEAFQLRGEALTRIGKLVGLVPDIGLDKALEQWERI